MEEKMNEQEQMKEISTPNKEPEQHVYYDDRPVGLKVILIAVLFVFIIGIMVSLIPEIPISPDFIYYKSYSVGKSTFKVDIQEIVSVKDEGKKYTIYLDNQDETKSAYDATVTVTEPEFNSIVGSTNDAITSTVYTLALYSTAHHADDSNLLRDGSVHHGYYINIYRYSALGETDFTSEEIAQYRDLAVPILNDADKSCGKEYDLSSLKDVADTHKIDFICKDRMYGNNLKQQDYQN